MTSINRPLSLRKPYKKKETANAPSIEDLRRFHVEDIGLYEKCRPINLKHYVEIQTKWIEDYVQTIETSLGFPPTSDRIANELLDATEPQRFRAYYAINNPEKVTWNL